MSNNPVIKIESSDVNVMYEVREIDNDGTIEVSEFRQSTWGNGMEEWQVLSASKDDAMSIANSILAMLEND